MMTFRHKQQEKLMPWMLKFSAFATPEYGVAKCAPSAKKTYTGLGDIVDGKNICGWLGSWEERAFDPQCL
jgi:hypothetical protein